MEGNLISTFFRRLLDALRIEKGPTEREPPDPEHTRKKQAFSVSSDGIPIRGSLFFPTASPERQYPVLIICHGIPGAGAPRPSDDPGYDGLANDFASMGLAATIFNFRGCGDSGGDFDMMGWTRDLDAVLERILDTPHVDPTRVMVLGFSGGGAAAIYVAAHRAEVYGLAAVGIPAHFGIFEKKPEEITKDFRGRGIIRDPGFPPDIDRWIKGFEEIEPRRWAAHFKGKHFLVVHGDADELIPVEHASEILDRAPKGITELSIIHGGEHRLRLNHACIELLKDWFLKTLGWRR
ncbi:MAG: alpha/beta fold hydrolase [Deltaproteobacteria bacterium]|nr:alpha/beta fold hydrolase [Deltaproteobacteria bacterium]